MRHLVRLALCALLAVTIAIAAQAQRDHAAKPAGKRVNQPVCPVTKEKISAHSPQLTVNRETVSVCCPKCIARLKQSPQKYFKRLKDPVNGKAFAVTPKTPKIEKDGALYLFSSRETYEHGREYLSGNGHGPGSPHSNESPKPHGQQHSGHRDAEEAQPFKAAKVAVGQAVPDFMVTDLTGAPLKLSELQKKTPSGVVALTYWCSFCHSCRHVEKCLDEFASQQREKATVVLIDASAGETPERVTAFAKKTGLSLPILLDRGGKSVDLFGIRATTTTLVIDDQGILRYRGAFKDGEREPAGDALEAVLRGNEVPKSETPQRG